MPRASTMPAIAMLPLVGRRSTIKKRRAKRESHPTATSWLTPLHTYPSTYGLNP